MAILDKIKSYKELIDTYIDETCFILGAGTSLYEQSSLPSFAKIFDHVVISVNAGIILCPWKDGEPNKRFWISNDASVRHWSFWPKVKSSKANRVVRNSWEKYYEEIKDFYFFPPRPSKEDVMNPGDEGLAYCSSVPSALDLAIQMGCKRIYLLGVDHYIVGGKMYFWQYWPKNKQPVGPFTSLKVQNNIFDINMSAFRALNIFAKNKNVEVFNCSLQSKVDAFKKINLETILETL